MKTLRAATAAMLLGLGVASAPDAQAAFVATMTEVGSDVILTGSGTLNLAGFVTPYEVYGSPPGLIIPNIGWMVGGPAPTSADYYTPFTGPTSFGSGGVTAATSGSGDRVGVRWDVGFEGIAVPQHYVSGDFLSGSSTYAGASLASLGVTPGTYVWSWGSGGTADSLTLIIADEAPIPEVGSLAILATGLAGMTLRRRRKGT